MTSEDKACDFVDKDMGFDFDFSNIELDDPKDKRVYVQADEASVATMGTVYGGSQAPEKVQQMALAGLADSGAVSVGDRAGVM